MATLSELLDQTEPSLLAEAQAEFERLVYLECAWGNCSIEFDPLTRRVVGGMGPLLCPCDHLPGWKGRRLEEMPKPRVPALARGRHGGQVQRSKRRHVLPDYFDELAQLD